MAQVLIRKVEASVLATLRAPAAGHPGADLAEEFAAIRARTPDKPHRLAEDLAGEGDER